MPGIMFPRPGAPGGSYRTDSDTLPGVGRDGRAVTAAIGPESWADRLLNLGTSIVDLYRARLIANANDPSGTVSKRRPVSFPIGGGFRITDDGVPKPLQQPGGPGFSPAVIVVGLALVAGFLLMRK
jgi:hypothetical protein